MITRSTLCRLKTTVRRTPTPSSRSRASSHRILSSLTHSGGFAASLDKIYVHVGIVCVESTSKNGFSDGWYALNPSHGQEGGETADSAFTSRVQGVSCFPGDQGRVGHIYRRLAVGCTTVRRASNGRFVSLTTQTVPDPGWFAQEPEATGVTSVQRSARWLSSTASRILSWRSPSTNCGYSGAEVDVRIEA